MLRDDVGRCGAWFASRPTIHTCVAEFAITCAWVYVDMACMLRSGMWYKYSCAWEDEAKINIEMPLINQRSRHCALVDVLARCMDTVIPLCLGTTPSILSLPFSTSRLLALSAIRRHIQRGLDRTEPIRLQRFGARTTNGSSSNALRLGNRNGGATFRRLRGSNSRAGLRSQKWRASRAHFRRRTQGRGAGC